MTTVINSVTVHTKSEARRQSRLSSEIEIFLSLSISISTGYSLLSGHVLPGLDGLFFIIQILSHTASVLPHTAFLTNHPQPGRERHIYINTLPKDATSDDALIGSGTHDPPVPGPASQPLHH